MKRPKEITAKLKIADVALANYTTQLEKENLKLHAQIAKLQVENVSEQNKTAALRKNTKPVNVIIHTDSEELKKLMTD